MSYRSTIARQPEALADAFAAARDELAKLNLAELDKPVIGITGIGASFAAAMVGEAELRAHGRRAFALRASDLADGRPLTDALIGLSHRGRSVETLAAMAKLPTAASLAITNDPDSPVAKAARMHLRLANGSDATPSSTGYTATLLVMGMAIDALLGRSDDIWGRLPGIAGQVLAKAGAKMGRLAKLFAARRAIDCVGDGGAYGTADEAVLLVREASRIPAASFDTRHYLHGPMEAMDPTTGVIVFGDGREIELADNLDRVDCPTLLLTTTAGIADSENLTVITVPKTDNLIARGIIDILSAQVLAAELSDAAGLTDTKFRYRMSDTKVPQS
ncbi:MAG: SIS domain-containing protein [Ancalomicrobiaceae bacterium]|nr:SIS domain-containing protein [Ancalomicrobiaceae bacterium]